MLVYKIHDLSDSRVIDILIAGLSDLDQSNENYSPLRKDSPANLFYILENGRFRDGAYYVIEEDGKFIAGSGWNQYTSDTALVLVRSYIVPSCRNKFLMAELLLPDMLNDCKDFEHVWITCNKYNKAIYNWFERAAAGKSPTVGSNWPEIYKNFEPIGIKTVNYTEQYVVQLRK